MNGERIGFDGQVRIYLGKCLRAFQNEKQWKNFVSSLIIILLISLVTGNDMFVLYKPTNSGCFAVICACIWIGLFNSIQSICRERAIIKREYRTGLRLGSYVTAHALYELMLSACEAFIVVFVVLIRNIAHLPEHGLILGVILDLYLSLFFTIFASDTMAMLVSSIVRDETTAMTVMPFVLIIQLVMSGTIFELKGVSEFIANFTVSRWGMAALMSISRTVLAVDAGAIMAGLDNAEPVAYDLLMNWIRMFAFAAAFLLLSVLALRRVDKDKR